MKSITKQKILNDPIYGFVRIYDRDPIVFQLVEHPYFQRLRRIKQLGLTHLVYPGALHTRFHHALGAVHIMSEAIEVIRSKGHEITEEEAKAVTIAVLLHDVGHGPFSHALEHSIVHHVTHEDISEMFMDRLNKESDGKLSLAIKIFRNEYRKKFLHQLVSSQLDMDRLDYLRRDSFYTGVAEGVISSDRIIKMLNVVKDELVVEEKGIYSIEKFIIARRLMYWQVYLHKTVLSAENLLVNILKRAKELAEKNEELFCTPALRMFLYNKFNKNSFAQDPALLDTYAALDDYDIMASVKVWKNHSDGVLARLCSNMVNRHLYRVALQNDPFKKENMEQFRKKAIKKYKITPHEAEYFVFSENVVNSIYNPDKIRINILSKDGKITDIADASDQLNLSVLARTIRKYFLCYPKDI